MKAAQFIYGEFNGKQLNIYSSPNLESILHPLSITRLMQLGKYVKEYTEKINIFETEKVVAYSFLYPTIGDGGRRNMWNHTIVIPFSEVFDDLKDEIRKHHVGPKRTLNFLLPLDVALE